MNSVDHEAFDVVGPCFGQISCIAVTATSSATDIAADAYVGSSTKAGRMLRLRADSTGGDVFYAWSASTGDTIVDTATGATAGKCGVIPAGQYVDERPPMKEGLLQSVLLLKTAAGFTNTLRISVTSKAVGHFAQGRY